MNKNKEFSFSLSNILCYFGALLGLAMASWVSVYRNVHHLGNDYMFCRLGIQTRILYFQLSFPQQAYVGTNLIFSVKIGRKWDLRTLEIYLYFWSKLALTFSKLKYYSENLRCNANIFLNFWFLKLQTGAQLV